MNKTFNTDGYCDPELHYMVNLSGRLEQIKEMVDAGKYFTINRARQYGKTTTLTALADYLKKDYEVISLDFQTLSSLSFESEQEFTAAFAAELLDVISEFPDGISQKLEEFAEKNTRTSSLQALFKVLKAWCMGSKRKLVLMIDEADTAANNQVFLDFLAQLRAYYLQRRRAATFQSVILAGVYDVRSIRRKLRPDETHRENSPWNIAADFDVNMSFSVQDIAGMLEEYETDYHTGMNIGQMAGLIYDYTSGYPYLVSRLCKIMDEKLAVSENFSARSNAWTMKGFLVAEKMLVKEDNALYQSLMGKLRLYPEFKTMLYGLLFTEKPIPYASTNECIRDAAMFGFIKNENDTAVISNRIFEAVLYNSFISEEFVGISYENTS